MYKWQKYCILATIMRKRRFLFLEKIFLKILESVICNNKKLCFTHVSVSLVNHLTIQYLFFNPVVVPSYRCTAFNTFKDNYCFVLRCIAQLLDWKVLTFCQMTAPLYYSVNGMEKLLLLTVELLGEIEMLNLNTPYKYKYLHHKL